MNLLENALYKLVTRDITIIRKRLDDYIMYGCNYNDLKYIKEKINRIQDMMNVVLGEDNNAENN